MSMSINSNNSDYPSNSSKVPSKSKTQSTLKKILTMKMMNKSKIKKTLMGPKSITLEIFKIWLKQLNK